MILYSPSSGQRSNRGGMSATELPVPGHPTLSETGVDHLWPYNPRQGGLVHHKDVTCLAIWPLLASPCLLSLCLAIIRASRKMATSGKDCITEGVAPSRSLIPWNLVRCICLTLLTQRTRSWDPQTRQHNSLRKPNYGITLVHSP